MGIFCEKCGNQLKHDAIYCSKCGHKIKNIALIKDEKAKSYVPIVDNNPAINNTYPQSCNKANRKLKSGHLIILIAGLCFVIVCISSFIFFVNSGNDVSKANKNGKQIFNFTAEEYIEKFNKINKSELKDQVEFSDFAKEVAASGNDVYSESIDGFAMTIYMDGNDKDSNVDTIKISVNNKDKDVPDCVLYAIKSIYPKLTYDEIEDIAKGVWDNSLVTTTEGETTYKDIQIKYEYEEFSTVFNTDLEYQYWTISVD